MASKACRSASWHVNSPSFSRVAARHYCQSAGSLVSGKPNEVSCTGATREPILVSMPSRNNETVLTLSAVLNFS